MSDRQKTIVLVLNIALVILSALSAQGVHLGLENETFQTVLAMLGAGANAGIHVTQTGGN